MDRTALRPAFYAAGSGRWHDCWLLLHPPYTAWHLSYVVFGAALAPAVHLNRFFATLAAFFLAVGICAHALDELQGRPLQTQIGSRSLVIVAAAGLTGSIALGIAGVTRIGPGLIAFMLAGVFLVLTYNLELFGGRLHTDAGFAFAWGSFPLLTAYFAQTGQLSPAALIAAIGAFFLSYAQRRLSTWARTIRRRTHMVIGELILLDGSKRLLDETVLLQPVEQALQALSWAAVALAVGLAIARLT